MAGVSGLGGFREAPATSFVNWAWAPILGHFPIRQLLLNMLRVVDGFGWFCTAVLIAALFILPTSKAAAQAAGYSGIGQLALNQASADGKGVRTSKPTHTIAMGTDWIAMFAPGTHLYPLYLADPLHPTTALNAVRYGETGIPNAGEQRYVFRIGGKLGLLRVAPADCLNRGIQLNLHGTFLGMFDREYSLDNIGWDGLYGLDLTWRHANGLALKFGLNHDSSHVGDEFAERTGIRRVDYTRQEYVVGGNFPIWRDFRGYGEAGWAFDLRNADLQEKWRVQTGLAYVNADCLWGGRMGFYAALDVTAYEESDWEPDITAQSGLLIPVNRINRNFRIGLEYRHGRSVIGEFSKFEETYWAWGFWIDL